MGRNYNLYNRGSRRNPNCTQCRSFDAGGCYNSGSRKMENPVNIGKTSLTLNSFDWRVLAERLYKGRRRFHVAVIQGYYNVNTKQPPEYTMLQIDPIYTIEEKEKGKLNKRRILERYDTHYLVIPENAAKHIRRRWQGRQKESNLVISFTEKSLKLVLYMSGQRQISALVLIPERVLCISNNSHEVAYYTSLNEQAPRHRVPDSEILNFASHGNSVTVRDIDPFDIADLEKRTTGRLTNHTDNVNECNFVRKSNDNSTVQNMENSTGSVIYNEITNLRLRPVMLDDSGDEYRSRGPYDYEFQAYYRTFCDA